MLSYEALIDAAWKISRSRTSTQADKKVRSNHNFIGFKVAKELLERSFMMTYGFPIKNLFLNEDLAIGTYRRGPSEVIPRLTQIAWKKKRGEIVKVDPTVTRRKFVYKLSRSNYESEWGREYRPLFVDGFRATLDQYQSRLGELKSNHLVLENKNLDTGKPVRSGEYDLADKTYSRLFAQLDEDYFKNVSQDLRNDLLLFYSHQTPALAQDPHSAAFQRTTSELEELRALR